MTGDIINHTISQKIEIPFSLDRERFREPETVGEYELMIAIPLGMEGELRLSSKHGSDSFRFLYTDIYSSYVRGIGDTPPDSFAGKKPLHLLKSGVWSFSACNETKGRFEKIITKFYPTDQKEGTFLLGATTRISAEEKTCIVYEIRLTPVIRKGLLSKFSDSCPFNRLRKQELKGIKVKTK